MSTLRVYQLDTPNDESYPRINFNLKANRKNDWLTLDDMLEGDLPVNHNFTSSINISLKIPSTKWDCLDLSCNFVISELAKQFWESLKLDFLFFCPIQVNSFPAYVMMVNNVLNVLNRSASEIRFRDDAARTIRSIDTYRFKKDLIPDPAIFRIPEHSARIFVTDSVALGLANSGLKGFCCVDFENPPPGYYVS